MKPRQVRSLVVYESGVLLVLGMILGNLLAFLTLYYFKDGLDISGFSKGTEMIGAGSIVYPTVKLKDLLVSNTLIIVIGLLSSFYPAWKATSYVPAEAIRKT